jgi:hypothetical protein
MALSTSLSTGSTVSTRSSAPALGRRPSSRAAGAAPAAAVTAPALATGLQREAQAQLALNELFPHLRLASDAALRDIFVSLRVPARPGADA